MRIREETTARDTRVTADYFIPIPWKGTKGIRVYLKSKTPPPLEWVAPCLYADCAVMAGIRYR